MDLHQLLVFGHIIGTVIGVGGATITDLFFFKFLRNGSISRDEFASFTLLSKIIMSGFILLSLSGVGFLALVYLNTGSLAGMPDKIIAKIVITGILGINSYFLSHKVMPLLKKSVGKSILPTLNAHSLLILTSGTISALSWYTTLILGSWRGLGASYELILGIYSAILITALIGIHTIGFKLLKTYIIGK